jgi:hypothetical protein
MRNYVLIIQGFEGILAEAFSNEDKKTTLKTLKVIKENSELAKLYTIVNNLRNGKVSEENVDSFINENIAFAKSIDYKKIAFPLDKSQKSDFQLHNDLGTILFEKKSAFNISEYNAAYSNVKKNLLEKKITLEKTKTIASKINESFNQIDIEDKVLVEKFVKTPVSERVNIFDETRSECIKQISKQINEHDDLETKVKMYKTKDIISEMVYNEKNYISDMVKIHELNKQLK